MKYNSTRASSVGVSAAQAIMQGISVDGGLFVPESLPEFTIEELAALAGKSYGEKAQIILSKFLTDFTEEELAACIQNAYGGGKFDSDGVFELSKVGESCYFLELWHGPTCAFKDMALQLLPQLLTASVKKVSPGQEVLVLVATSGDTGKAALEGFKDVPGVKIAVFYPENGVAEMQRLQMVTQEGGNLLTAAIQGNFDDAQSGVKQIFTDPSVKGKLAERGMVFSSANSINWGRLAPQVVYYIACYVAMMEKGEILPGEEVNVAVPTGNFGNLLAAYYAKRMGVPFGTLICASNRNNVLTDFIDTGIYDRNRDFYATNSPSMDILVSSNLERLLYELSGRDDGAVRGWFAALQEDGEYEVDEAVKEALAEGFWGGSCNDGETLAAIGRLFREYGYLCDTHTAVAAKAYWDYLEATGDERKVIIVSTASPYKFSDSVLRAISDTPVPDDPFEQAALLQRLAGVPAPPSLMSLKGKGIRFTESVAKDKMADYVLSQF